MHMHMPPRSDLLLYTFTVPVMVVSVIIAILSIISLVLWAFGTYQVPG